MSITLTPRRTAARVCYPSGFDVQSDFDTPLAASACDAVFNLVPDTDPKLEFLETTDDIVHCSGRFIQQKRVLTRFARFTFSIYVEPGILFGLAGWNLGVVAGSDALMLPIDEYEMPVTTLVYAKANSVEDPKILKSMALVKMELGAAPNQRIALALTFEGSADTDDAAGFVIPECNDPAPVYLNDGFFTVNSVDYTAYTRELAFTYDNRPPVEDRFTGADINPDHIETDDIRQHDFKWTKLGETGDTLDEASRTVPSTYYPVQWRIGSGTDGVLIDAASAELKPDGGESFGGGGVRRSTLGLALFPKYIDGDGDTPVKFTRLT
jgi:hypothetical protein